MEVFVPALLLAILAQLGDRPALLTAMLADRTRRPLAAALGGALAHAAGNGIAATGGAYMAPMLTPNAQALLLAIALLVGGGSAFWPVKAPPVHERWQVGAFLTSLFGVGILMMSDRTPFFTLALAARGEPWLAAAGAAIGAAAVGFVAAVLGEQGWRALPLGKLRIAIGILFVAAALYIGLGALRLR